MGAFCLCVGPSPSTACSSQTKGRSHIHSVSPGPGHHGNAAHIPGEPSVHGAQDQVPGGHTQEEKMALVHGLKARQMEVSIHRSMYNRARGSMRAWETDRPKITSQLHAGCGILATHLSVPQFPHYTMGIILSTRCLSQ